MRRQLNLRQIEAFKAVVELGTVTRASEVLNVSQPALSKLIAHLEADTGIKLFDRHKRRLAPTKRGMRLYDEVGRIFAGVRQVESAVDAIRREDQGRLTVGVIPALSGPFIQRATSRFLVSHPNVFCSVGSVSSQWIVERVISRQIDVGVVGAAVVNPYVVIEPLMTHSLVCVMPRDHELAKLTEVDACDLEGVPFITLPPDTYSGRVAGEAFQSRDMVPNIVLIADTMPIVCEFVASGVGVSLVHPLVAAGYRDRLEIRPFVPEVESTFQLCWNRESRDSKFIEAFAEDLRTTAQEMSKSIFP